DGRPHAFVTTGPLWVTSQHYRADQRCPKSGPIVRLRKIDLVARQTMYVLGVPSSGGKFGTKETRMRKHVLAVAVIGAFVSPAFSASSESFDADPNNHR